ncbi:uncharacterized protein [Henckelia pumila]|uniref:uncharacterized protein n=1 Tax=Henckelia pumila TaxID=405737 RepID=UPI003C6E6327
MPSIIFFEDITCTGHRDDERMTNSKNLKGNLKNRSMAAARREEDDEEGFFQSRRGIRQGDPLSPLQFIIVAEYLSRGLDSLFEQNRSLLFRTGRPFRLSHLAYADDIILFSNGSIPGIRLIRDFLYHYEQCSGQLISNAKSFIFTAKKCPQEKKGRYYSITGFGEGVLPFRYLGATMFVGHRKRSYFNHIFVNASRKLQGWQSKSLSFGSRLVLIKSVLCSMPIFLLQVLQPPGIVLHRFEMLCANFLWGSNPGGHSIHWISWAKICLPTAEGGLGIRRLKDMVTSFSIKL